MGVVRGVVNGGINELTGHCFTCFFPSLTAFRSLSLKLPLLTSIRSCKAERDNNYPNHQSLNSAPPSHG